MNNSQKPGSLRKVRCNKAMCIDKISITRLNFKSIRNGQEYINKLKGLPKIQRSVHNTYTCARKIFVNGVMESNRLMQNKMKTQYYGAFTLQEEADEQEWTRYLLRNSTEIRGTQYFSQKVDKK